MLEPMCWALDNRAMITLTLSGVVGFEDGVLGAHGPRAIAAGSVSRSGRSSAMEVSEK